MKSKSFTGQDENPQFSFKEDEAENITGEDESNQNGKQEQIQRNAAHLNQIKDRQNQIHVQKTDENFDLMIQNANHVDQRTKALMTRNKPLISKIFPNKMDKLLAEMEHNTIQESLQFRLNLYKLNTQFILEGLREKYDAGLKMIKSEYRSQLAGFMTSKLEAITKDVRDRQFSFIQIIREKNQFLLTMSDIPSTAARYSEQIEREQDRYFNFLEQLVINFENIISEELKKFS